ncbi:MAG: BT_2262 family domain-containing protein [Flavobacteriales bacterium]
MKKLLILISSVLLIYSCANDDTSDVSRVTSFPIVTVLGNATELIEQGTTFTDPGATATENGKDIPVQASNSSGVYWSVAGVDTNSPDKYTVTYSATNSDGFDGTASRDVWVASTGDLVSSIEGLYLSSIERVGSDTQSNLKYVIIKSLGGNQYELSHALGGYYDIGRAYGTGYACRGAVITANDIATNDFSITQSQFPIWGYTTNITNFTVNAASKTITFSGIVSFGGVFNVTLNQVQL